MYFFTFLLAVIGFFYLSGRISRLESIIKNKEIIQPSKVQEPEKKTSVSHPIIEEETISKPVQPIPAQEQSKISPVISITQDKEFEFKLGSKAFTVIGAIAVLFGVGFFLRYAFENNLITETTRVILGIVGGFVMLAVGW